jgi:hypothetical protein
MGGAPGELVWSVLQVEFPASAFKKFGVVVMCVNRKQDTRHAG